MREIRPYGSEGGGPQSNAVFLPLLRWPVEDTEASPVYLAPMTRACAGPTGPWVFGVPVSIDVSVLADLPDPRGHGQAQPGTGRNLHE